MPTAKEHIELVVRQNEGGVFTDENRWDENYVLSIINQARAYVLRQDFIKTKRWSPSALQTFYPDYEEYYQNSACSTRFKLPTSLIQANSTGDGLVYFGSSSNDVLTTTNFRRIQNRAMLSDILSSSRMTPASGKYTGFLLEADIATIISKDSIRVKYPFVVGVFNEPQLVTGYNLDVDTYPISNDLAVVMYEVIEKGTMRFVYSKPPDNISNTNPIPQGK